MNLTQQTIHPRRFLEETYYWFACPIHDCNQRYDTGYGYYVMRDGAVEDILYMAKRGTTMADTLWLCANEKCRSRKGTT